MTIYTIYKATNLINGKCYIGFASDLVRRKAEHKSASFNYKHKDYSCYFHNAIRKYGWDNFEWEIIYQSIDRDHTLKEMEPYFIKVNDPEYNLTTGGEGTFGYRRNPDKNIYKFIHPEHGIFTGTRYELSNTFGINKSSLGKVIKGSAKYVSCNGWKLVNSDGSTRSKNSKIKYQRIVDHTIYTFSHPIHGIFIGKRVEARDQLSITLGGIHKLIKGECLQYHGWTISGKGCIKFVSKNKARKLIS